LPLGQVAAFLMRYRKIHKAVAGDFRPTVEIPPGFPALPETTRHRPGKTPRFANTLEKSLPARGVVV